MRLMKFPDFKGERQVSSAPELPLGREALIQPDSNEGTPARISLRVFGVGGGQAAGPGSAVAPVAVEIGKPEMLIRLMEFLDFKGERQVSSAPVLPFSREALVQPDSMKEHPQGSLCGCLVEGGSRQLGPGSAVAPVAVEIGKPER
ncbi:hypothetical protein BBD40_25490 [Paenibacillus ihbetae]|uniref:Uncharacterized protein n=1 Tax=Paenibacillus ihbetae TaxID=1870820 RepID=A0ABX3JQ94_9BACL|nr:hypothetical protein BBD40_25490 [Paenibacillus ihbetae]